MPKKNPNAALLRFCPQCGAGDFRTDGRKSFSCSRCRFKLYLNCAAAAIALIFVPDGRIIVTRRKYDPAKGSLDFPGGFAEPGETIEHCLAREVKEELNLEVAALSYFCSLPNTYVYRDITYDITDFVFICRVDCFDRIRPADDILDYDLLDPERLEKDRFGLDSPRRLAEQIRNGARRGKHM